jgi:hypothetical protein
MALSLFSLEGRAAPIKAGHGRAESDPIQDAAGRGVALCHK